MKYLLSILAFVITAYASFGQKNGSIDSTFNKTGWIKENYATSNSICVDNSNKTLVLGHDNATGGYNIYVKRYLNSGSIDNTFGANGVFENDLNNDKDYGRCIVPLSNGKYIVSGQNSMGSYFRTFIMRLNNDGTIDRTFGQNGYTIIDNNENSDAWNVAVDQLGSIYVAGYKTINGKMNCAIWKLKANGSFATDFGTSGELILSTTNESERLFDIELRDNKIAVAGYSNLNGICEGFVAVMDTLGSLDKNFNSVGYLKVNYQASNTYLKGVGLMSNGKVVCCGAYSNASNEYYGLVAVYTKNGVADSAFSTDGCYYYSSAPSFFITLQIDCKNAIYVAGYKTISSSDIVLKKLNANGSLDVSFANNSEFSERFNSQNDEAIETFAFVNNSKIVFAGRIDSDGNTSSCGIGRVNINACSDFNGIVETQLLKNLINVYPNPQKSGTTISIDISEIEDQFQTWTIQLIDMNGRLILENVQSPVNGLLKLETTQIAPGVYDVAINKSCSKKIIIN
jgi:uncharacterized delta-60 repeat protein